VIVTEGVTTARRSPAGAEVGVAHQLGLARAVADLDGEVLVQSRDDLHRVLALVPFGRDVGPGRVLATGDSRHLCAHVQRDLDLLPLYVAVRRVLSAETRDVRAVSLGVGHDSDDHECHGFLLLGDEAGGYNHKIQ
jgi:hypothetical protein